MRALFATPMAALIAAAGLTLGASGTAAAAMTINISGADCTATNASANGSNVDVTISCTATTPPTPGVPTGCTLSASNSSPTAGQSYSVTGRCTGGTAPITFALSGPGVPGGTTLNQGSANSASTSYLTNAGTTVGTTYTYTAQASNGGSPVSVSPVTVTVASAPPPPPPTTGAPDCKAQGFANTRFIRLSWSPAIQLYSRDVGGFGPDDALVLELTVPANATVTNTLRTISGAEYIDLGVPRSAFLSTKACDFTTATFGYGSESAGTSFGVSFAVGTANSAGKWAFPNPVPPKVAPGTKVYLNVKNATPGSCGSGSCNVFATFK